jgi:hypothetical protein
MQTFLPSPDFALSAKLLDYKRLGKQRVEAAQILKAITDSSYGWQSHPAVNQWRPFPDALKAYYNAIVKEWIDRGYVNNMPYPLPVPHSYPKPPWLGSPSYHLSHQSNLIRKDPEHYAHLFPGITATLPYVWPSKQELDNV